VSLSRVDRSLFFALDFLAIPLFLSDLGSAVLGGPFVRFRFDVSLRSQLGGDEFLVGQLREKCGEKLRNV